MSLAKYEKIDCDINKILGLKEGVIDDKWSSQIGPFFIIIKFRPDYHTNIVYPAFFKKDISVFLLTKNYWFAWTRLLNPIKLVISLLFHLLIFPIFLIFFIGYNFFK